MAYLMLVICYWCYKIYTKDKKVFFKRGKESEGMKHDFKNKENKTLLEYIAVEKFL